MRIPGPRRPPTATVPRREKPALRPWAVRAVDRWGFLGSVTGLLANVLLAVLFTTPAGGPYAWAGSANDIVSVVATLAMIPVAAALLAACGNSPGLGAITSLAILAMIAIPAALLLIVLSYRLPGHLADRVGSARRSSPRGPRSRLPPRLADTWSRGEGHTV